VVKVEESEVDGDEKNKKNKKDCEFEIIIAFHGRWSWNLSKMQKNKERFLSLQFVSVHVHLKY
jgi:hypothetical protein